jgi:hypothetical protein
VPTSPVRRFNSEIVKFFSGPKLCSEPAWLFPATRPSLRRPLGISKLRNHFGVWTPCAAHMLVAWEDALAKLSQPLLKPTFLGRYPARQDRCDLFVKRPKLLHGHRFEIIRFHFLTRIICPCFSMGIGHLRNAGVTLYRPVQYRMQSTALQGRFAEPCGAPVFNRRPTGLFKSAQGYFNGHLRPKLRATPAGQIA